MRKSNINKSNESYEKIHTDTSLFYKVLREFTSKCRVKHISVKEDLNDIKEGDIISCEGKISGNEIESLFNKFYVFVEAMGLFGKDTESIMSQISGIEKILKNDERVTSTENMVCKLDDGTQLLTVIETKYLLNDSGIDLVRGKYKILGLVYEKIDESESISLARDTLLELFKPEDLEKMYTAFADGLKVGLNIPTIQKNINGPSIGIIPIGIYL